MIRAIPTMFNGILYRSKLEACWAAFFATLSIVYEYELEGYELPSGLYLPDFWLPAIDGGMWAEVKAREPEDREIDLAEELMRATGHHCVILVGSPRVAIDSGRYPFLLCRWSMDVLLRAALLAHRAVRWDPKTVPAKPVVKVPKRVGKAWQRRQG